MNAVFHHGVPETRRKTKSKLNTERPEYTKGKKDLRSAGAQSVARIGEEKTLKNVANELLLRFLWVLRIQIALLFSPSLRDSVVKNFLSPATARDGLSCLFVRGPTAFGFALVPILLATSERQFALRSPVSKIDPSGNEG